MTSTLSSRKLATTLAVAGLAVTAAPAGAVPDYGSPSAASDVDQTPAVVQDLRSPDARDASSAPRVAQTPAVVQDLRSPDVRDVATGYRPEPIATVDAGTVSGSGGFDWASAAIGVAAVGGVAILLLGLVGLRRHHTPGAHPA
jgi:hypothetical protein